jgi:iron(III) transport system substrate-binding protein
VILYNTRLLRADEAPRSVLDLAAPRYRGRVAIANPLFGTTATHVAALFARLGSARAKEFLSALKANEVQVAAGNAMARNLVADGEVAICLTDTDDANGALLKAKPVALVYPDQEDGGLGTLVIPNTVALVRGAPHPEAARKLIEFLASAEVEERLARSKAAQMPLRDGIEPHSALFDLRRIRRMEVDWNEVARQAEESAEFVRSDFLE